MYFLHLLWAHDRPVLHPPQCQPSSRSTAHLQTQRGQLPPLHTGYSSDSSERSAKILTPGLRLQGDGFNWSEVGPGHQYSINLK